MNIKTLSPLLLLSLSTLTWADNSIPLDDVPLPLPFEQKLPSNPDTVEQKQAAPPLAIQPTAALQLTETDLQQNPTLVAQLINQAIQAKQWDFVAELLTIYRQQADADPVLLAYAHGAWLRAQGRQSEAIAEYRKIATPAVPYVQLDLALMLTEDKQYREAKQILTELEQNQAVPEAQQVAAAYHHAINQSQAWQPSLSLNFEQTDNVNNAADTRIIDWNGRQWRKTEDSLPKSAHGIRYGAGLSRTLNLNGHHFAQLDTSINGVHYWDAQDFNEQSLRLAAGYRWQDIRQDAGLQPFVEQNWLGGTRYNHNIGLTVDYNRQFNPSWRLGSYIQYSEKRYQDESLARRYNSRLTLFGSTLSYRAQPGWLLYAGLDVANDDTLEREQASWRYGLRAGTAKQFSNGLGMRANLRYTRREFKAPAQLVYEFTRRDHEYSANTAIWHERLSWKGLTPRLNFRYLKIDSNMSGFYSRNSKEWFISLEKNF